MFMAPILRSKTQRPRERGAFSLGKSLTRLRGFGIFLLTAARRRGKPGSKKRTEKQTEANRSEENRDGEEEGKEGRRQEA
jgi:hypothetical protein